MNHLPESIGFWICSGTLLFFLVYFTMGLSQGWGLPAAAVLVTVGVWYLGDVIYNESNEYEMMLGSGAVNAAWWQLWLFMMAFGLMVGPLSRRINSKLANKSSRIVRLFSGNGLGEPRFQRSIDRLTWLVAMVWLTVICLALIRVEGDIVGMVAPYLGHRAEPWARTRIGGGVDSLLSLAGYIQLFCATGSGILFSIAKRPGTRILAGCVASLAVPYFVFHPRRNVILIALVPAVLSWVFLRLRGNIWLRMACLLPFVAGLHLWFGFVIQNRSKASIAEAFSDVSVGVGDEKSKHKGLNMFEELVWINALLDSGRFDLNYGTRYLAELSNPIPRALWPNKPTIGIDYAIARGYGATNADEQGGVHATISTGMIGQGVTNFGGVLGPLAAAFLMSLWVTLLARLDLLSRDPGQLLLYMLGCILTFNLGRDITLLTMYPMFFGLIILGTMTWLRGINGKNSPSRGSATNRVASSHLVGKSRSLQDRSTRTPQNRV